MLRIGPSGNSKAFYESGKKSTHEAPQWLADIGLTAYEYSFGRGVNLSDETASKIGSEMRKYNIALSGHAPYYINFANTEPEKIQKSFDYVRQSLIKTLLMSGNRVVFHAAAQGKLSRTEAMNLTKKNIEKLIEYLLACNDIGSLLQARSRIIEEERESAQAATESMFGCGKNVENIEKNSSAESIIICPETMGKLRQIGTVEEVVEICALHEMLYPCFDFGHINCYMNGALKSYDDYRRIIDYTYEKLGKEKTFNMHIHFSKIQYGNSGEIRHLTLADEVYGPEYLPLARVIDDYEMTPVIICESNEIMSDDALQMRQCHKSLREDF